MGVILASQKKNSEVLAALQRAEKLDPSQPEAHYRMAKIYKQMDVDWACEDAAETARSTTSRRTQE